MSKEYSLSMSGSRVRIAESMATVRLFLEIGDWDEVRRRVVEDNVFQLNAESSRKRVAGELVKRLQTLTAAELEFLDRSYGDDRHAMLWVAVCRTYRFVRDLSEQEIAARYNRTIPDFTEPAFEAFFDEQSELHPELSEVSEAGRRKIRSQVFLMLRECGLLTGDNVITPLLFSPLFESALDAGHASDLDLFPRRRL